MYTLRYNVLFLFCYDVNLKTESFMLFEKYGILKCHLYAAISTIYCIFFLIVYK